MSECNEVSIHEVKVWLALLRAKEWSTSREIGRVLEGEVRGSGIRAVAPDAREDCRPHGLNPVTRQGKKGKGQTVTKKDLQRRIRSVEVDLRLVREKVDDSVPLLETRNLIYEVKAKLDQLWAELFDTEDAA